VAFPGYVVFHRGEKISNKARRLLGGFIGIPKDPRHILNDGTKRNRFYSSGKYSQEEFPMAFMKEGGRYTPPYRKVGDLALEPGIERSPVFRCIDETENKGIFSIPKIEN